MNYTQVILMIIGLRPLVLMKMSSFSQAWGMIYVANTPWT